MTAQKTIGVVSLAVLDSAEVGWRAGREQGPTCGHGITIGVERRHH
jgi:hypothetical protein